MFINIHEKMKVAMMLIKIKKIQNKNYEGNSGEEDDDDEKKTSIKRKRQTDKQASAALFLFDWVCLFVSLLNV